MVICSPVVSLNAPMCGLSLGVSDPICAGIVLNLWTKRKGFCMELHSLRWHLVDNPQSCGARLRKRRAHWLADTFPDLAQMSLIDLGGRVDTWEQAPVRPNHVHVVNLERKHSGLPVGVLGNEGFALAGVTFSLR